MAEESKKFLDYDPIEEDDLAEEPASASHTDLPDPDGGQAGGTDAELRKRKEQALERIRCRNARFDRSDEDSST